MNEWAAGIVRRMSLFGVTGLELAKAAGFSNSYLSAVLHGKKGNEKTRRKVEEAMTRIECEQSAVVEKRTASSLVSTV